MFIICKATFQWKAAMEIRRDRHDDRGVLNTGIIDFLLDNSIV